MATINLKKSKTTPYGIWVLKSTEKDEKYLAGNSHSGVSLGILKNSLRFAVKSSAENYQKSWLLNSFKPVRVWTTKPVYDKAIFW